MTYSLLKTGLFMSSGNKAAPALAIAAGMAMVASSTVSAGTLQEQHSFTHLFSNPSFGSGNVESWDVPQFDTQGGSRHLVAMQMNYELLYDYSITVGANTTSESVVPRRTGTTRGLEASAAY